MSISSLDSSGRVSFCQGVKESYMTWLSGWNRNPATNAILADSTAVAPTDYYRHGLRFTAGDRIRVSIGGTKVDNGNGFPIDANGALCIGTGAGEWLSGFLRDAAGRICYAAVGTQWWSGHYRDGTGFLALEVV